MSRSEWIKEIRTRGLYGAGDAGAGLGDGADDDAKWSRVVLRGGLVLFAKWLG